MSHAESTTPAPPGRIAGFDLVRKLGEGGMGVVWEAEQRVPRRRVALKVIRGGQFVDETTIRLFQREVQALALLRHPGIAAFHESGRTDDGQHFFAMELVEGPTLSEFLRGRPGPDSSEELRLRLGLFREICEAVHHAHQRGIIHRDLKPANILVSDGSIKILDFGLARITDADLAAGSAVTELGTLRGTVSYMSPEQLRGDPAGLDLRTDVYTLGVVLHEMLTGRLPYALDDVSPFEIPRIVTDVPPLALSRSWPRGRAPADLATIVAKALQKDPGLRYASAAALGDDVGRFLEGEPILARPPSAAYEFGRLVRRNRLPFAAAGAALVVLVGFAAAMTLLSARLARARDEAKAEARRAERETDRALQLGDVLSELLLGGASYGAPTERLDAGGLVARIDSDPGLEPGQRIRLLQSIAALLGRRGDLPEALDALQRLRRRAEQAGAEDVRLAARLALAELEMSLWRLADADRDLLALRADIQRTSRAVTPNQQGNVLENLGLLRRHQGRFPEAEQLLRDALGAYASAGVPSPYLVASAWDSLGHLYVDWERYDDAQLAFERALRLRTNLGTPAEHGQTLCGVGLVQLGRDEPAAARRTLRDALHLREQGLGPRNASVGRTMALYALARAEDGDLVGAEETARRARAILDERLPSAHPYRSLPLLALGEAHLRAGRARDAVPLLRQAVAQRAAALGPSHPALRPDLRRLARALRAAGDAAGARDALARVPPLP